MKTFQALEWDSRKCLKEVREFERLLASSPRLKERDHILPFFKERLHLSAFLTCLHQDAIHYDLVAHEYDLFGDFVCDLAVGDSRRKIFGFVEFEDASPGGVFLRKRGKSSPEWSPRLEHGFSQVVDWFYKLADMERTDEYMDRFGERSIQCFGLVVVGRDEPYGEREKHRLRWRQEKTLINGHKVRIMTFDQLCADLIERAEMFLLSGTIAKGRKRRGKRK
jgi:hypothetical protein